MCKVLGKVVDGLFYYQHNQTINDHNHAPDSHMRTYEAKPRALPLKNIDRQSRPIWRDPATGKLLSDDGEESDKEEKKSEEEQRREDAANGIIWFRPKLKRAWDPPVIKAKDLKRDDLTGYVVVSLT